MKMSELLARCEEGQFLDPDDVFDESAGDRGINIVTAMVFLPQRAAGSLEEIADSFHIQYGTLHGWGEYEMSVWARAGQVGRAGWRQFIEVVERVGGSIEIDEEELEQLP